MHPCNKLYSLINTIQNQRKATAKTKIKPTAKTKIKLTSTNESPANTQNNIKTMIN